MLSLVCMFSKMTKPSKIKKQQNEIIILAKALKIISIFDQRYGFYDKNRIKRRKDKERFHCSHKRRTYHLVLKRHFFIDFG